MRILHDLGVADTRFSFFMDSSPKRSLELDGILWQQYRPNHTEFPPTHWEWNAEGVKGTAARMEQLCVHALAPDSRFGRHHQRWLAAGPLARPLTVGGPGGRSDGMGGAGAGEVSGIPDLYPSTTMDEKPYEALSLS